MSATANSSFQKIRTNHINNIPPNCYPRQDNETDKQYLIRMASQGLSPDIDVDESDAAYLARLASYQPAPLTASYATFAISSTSAATSISASYALSASYSP